MHQHYAGIVVLLLSGCGNIKSVVTAPTSATAIDAVISDRKANMPPVMALANISAPLEILKSENDLGKADFGETRQARFLLRNRSNQKVELQTQSKSCTCTAVHISTEFLQPGDETVITLSWTPKVELLESSLVRLWTDIMVTPMGQQIRLEATGSLDPIIHVNYPRGPLDFGKLCYVDLESVTRVVEVYSRRQHFEAPDAQVDIPGIVVTTLEPLNSDRLSELEAQAGYRLLLQPTTKLNHGGFRGELILQTTARKSPLRIPISGEFDTATVSLSENRWQLPPRISIHQGYKLPSIQLNVRFGRCTRCELESITPPVFTGRVKAMSEKSWKIELELIRDEAEILKNIEAAAWQQMLEQGFEHGAVRLKLDHPEVKQITIPIGGTQIIR